MPSGSNDAIIVSVYQSGALTSWRHDGGWNRARFSPKPSKSVLRFVVESALGEVR